MSINNDIIGFIVNFSDGISKTYMVARRIGHGYQNPYYLVDVNSGIVIDYKCYKSPDTIEKRYQRMIRQGKVLSYNKIKLKFNIKED